MDRSALEQGWTFYIRVDCKVEVLVYLDYAVLVFKLLLNWEIWKVYLPHGLPFDFLTLTNRHSRDRDRHMATWRPVFRTLIKADLKLTHCFCCIRIYTNHSDSGKDIIESILTYHYVWYKIVSCLSNNCVA